MSTTVSASANAREPVTLCYKRRYKLLSHNSPDSPPLPLPSSPASYPTPPLYRNTYRLPFVQTQWFQEALEADARRQCRLIEPPTTEVGELKADWQWTIGRVVKRMCKAEGVHLTKGTKTVKDGEQLGEGEEAKEAEEEKTEVRAFSEFEEKEAALLITVDAADDAQSADHTSTRRAFLSPTRQRKVSEEEETDEANALSGPLTRRASTSTIDRKHDSDEKHREPASPPAPSALSLSPTPGPPSSLVVSSAASSTSASPRGGGRGLTALQASVLASFNPLPGPFLARLRVSEGGRTREVRVDKGEGTRLGQLRDQWRWGVREGGRMGVLCVLEVYGFVVWVKDDEGKSVSWARQLRDKDSEPTNDKGDKRKK